MFNTAKEIQSFIVLAQCKGWTKSATVVSVYEMVAYYNLPMSAESLVDSVW